MRVEASLTAGSGRGGHHGDDGTAGSQLGSLRDPKVAAAQPKAEPGVGTTPMAAVEQSRGAPGRSRF